MAWVAKFAAAAGICACLSAGVFAQGQSRMRLEGRRLDEALAHLQKRGLRIIYSNELVRPDMRVRTEPRATSLRRILDELLTEHGLMATAGPAGNLLVVKNPRSPVVGVPMQQKNQPPPNVEAGAQAPPRFAEAIGVTDVQSWRAGAGPPPFAIPPAEVRAVAGGFENIFRTLQALPGVAATDELGSRIAVRGGSPDQNLTVVDGIEVPHPYRLVVPSEDLALVGLASTFNPETIESFEFFAGAFDARHGDRLSSLLIVKHREGSEARALQGSSSLTLAEANVILEGTLPGRSAGSWLVSTRRSHLDLVAERVIDGTLPSFRDMHARLAWRPRPAQRVLAVGIAGGERIRPTDSPEADSSHATKTANNLLALTFESSIGSVGMSRTVASRSRFADTLNGVERSLDGSRGANNEQSLTTGGLLQFQLSRDVGIRDLAVRQEAGFTLPFAHWLDMGIETHRLETRWAWRISGDRSQNQANGSSVRLGTGLPGVLDSTRESVRLGAWVQDRWQISSRLTVQPGLRVDRSTITRRATFSPRLSGALNLGGALRLNAAFGVHTQSPGYEKVLQSDYFVDLSPSSSAALTSERARHVVAGVQRVFKGGSSARVDVYYKRYSDLLIGRLESNAERLERLAGYDVPAPLWAHVPTRAQITTAPLNAAAGRAYGVEVHFAHAGSGAATPLTGWATYSLGRANRTAYGVTYPFDYDRRHALNIVANLRLGPRLDLSATARWATGMPRTPVVGVRLALVEDAGDADHDGNREERVPQRDDLGHPMFQPDLGDLSSINSARAPYFGRLDARLRYRPRRNGERWTIYLDLVNLLNANNAAQVDSALVFDPMSDRPAIVETTQDRGIPFFPSLGMRVRF